MKLKNFVVLICLSALWPACGGRTGGSPTAPQPAAAVTPPAPVTPPAAAVRKAIATVMTGMTKALNATRSGSKSLSLSEGLRTGGGGVVQPHSLTMQCNKSGTSCSIQFNETFSQRTDCSGGGFSSVSSTLTGVIQSTDDNPLSGTLNTRTRFTFGGCSENGWVMSTSSSILINGSVYITGKRTRINLTFSGGFLFTNAPGTPAGSSTCVFNGVLLQWDDITGNWAKSGSMDCNPGGSFKI